MSRRGTVLRYNLLLITPCRSKAGRGTFSQHLSGRLPGGSLGLFPIPFWMSAGRQICRAILDVEYHDCKPQKQTFDELISKAHTWSFLHRHPTWHSNEIHPLILRSSVRGSVRDGKHPPNIHHCPDTPKSVPGQEEFVYVLDVN